jgi:serine/threonine protein kinase
MEAKEQEDLGALAPCRAEAAEHIAAVEDSLTTRAVEEYRALLRAGYKPNRAQFLACHPEAAPVLSECLDALEFIHAAASQMQTSGADLLDVPANTNGIGPDALLGDFRILREVGRGGMGVVYEAMQASLGRRVALKVLPFAAGLEPRQLQRFKTEAQAAARLHHNNIVPVHAVGCERGTHYYAMQFIDGQTLAAVISDLRCSAGLEAPAGVVGDGREERAPAPAPVPSSKTLVGRIFNPSHFADGLKIRPTDAAPTRHTAALSTERSIRSPEFFRIAARLALQAAEALDYAHRQDVIHRDVKPANLLVDGHGNLWITDFGLARLQREAGLTVTGDLLGTLRYMSPEQALGERAQVDHRTDIYSLGATIYELLTLEPAIQGSERLAVLRRIEREEPPRLRSLNPAVPQELQTIVQKAMAKDPADRYPTAQELADDLQRFLDDKPIRARRPTLVQRTAKWRRRHRGIVLTGSAAVVVGLFLGIMGLVISNVRIRDEQARAEAARKRADHNLALAMDALNRIYVQVAEERFFRVDHLPPEDRELLRLALGFYEQLARQNDDDPAVRQAVADASFRVGDIESILGEPSRAREAYQRGLAIREQRAAESPADYGCRAALAGGHQCLAKVLRTTGDRPAAGMHYRKALDLWIGLAADFPNAAEARQLEAACHTDLGMFVAADGAWAASEHHHRQAMALRAQLVADAPTDDRYREGLANSHWNLGKVAFAVGRNTDAEGHLRQALEVQSRLTTDHPNVNHYLQEEAFMACDLATFLGLRDPDAARRHYQRALDLRGRLAASWPSIPEYRHELAETHDKLAILLAGESKREESAQHFREAVEIHTRLVTDFPDVLRYREGLATVHGNLGCLLIVKEPQAAKKHLARQIELLDGLPAADAGSAGRRRGLGHARHNLGVLLEHAGEWALAADEYRRAVDLWSGLADEVPATPYYRYHLGLDHRCLGSLVYASGKQEEGTNHLRRALALWEPLASTVMSAAPTAVSETDFVDDLVQLLADAPEPSLRDPGRAVALAQKTVERTPRREGAWSALGLACYRGGDPRAALDALKRANHLRGEPAVVDALLLALVYWHLDDKAQARQWYDKAATFMKSGQTRSAQVRRFRDEAAAELGIDESAALPVR